MKPEKYWKNRLLELKAELTHLEEESAEGREAVELDQSRVGRLSRMDALQAQAMNNAIAARRKQTLMRIEAAFERLKEGEFGYCLSCGDEIVKKRLELDPTIPTCTNCGTSA
jgi:DnaK suppressor protein